LFGSLIGLHLGRALGSGGNEDVAHRSRHCVCGASATRMQPIPKGGHTSPWNAGCNPRLEPRLSWCPAPHA
jgi:hypothetical protein